MDGLEVPRSSFKKRLWLSARRKKLGRPKHNRKGKENVSPGNRNPLPAATPPVAPKINGAIISDPDILDHIGPAATSNVPDGRKVFLPFTSATNDWSGQGGPFITKAQVHQVLQPHARSIMTGDKKNANMDGMEGSLVTDDNGSPDSGTIDIFDDFTMNGEDELHHFNVIGSNMTGDKKNANMDGMEGSLVTDDNGSPDSGTIDIFDDFTMNGEDELHHFNVIGSNMTGDKKNANMDGMEGSLVTDDNGSPDSGTIDIFDDFTMNGEDELHHFNFIGNSTPRTTSTCSLNIEMEVPDNNINEEEDNVISGRRLFEVQYLWYDIYTSISPILNNSESLLMGRNNNIVEQFNAIIAKFIGGKRVNYSLRNSYQTRCYAAAIQHNTKSLIETLHAASANADGPEDMGTFSSMYVEKRQKLLKRKSNYDRKSKRAKKTMGADEHYGCIEAEADLEIDLYHRKMELFLKNLEKSPEEIFQIEQNTIGQASNPEWVKERKLRLTASMFGQVCKMKQSTSCKNTVKNMLYSTFKGSDATRYGNRNEPIAAKETESLLGFKIKPCGIFIDHEHPYLGASPDGLIGHDSIIEIKCPAVAANLTPKEAIIQKKITFCSLDVNDAQKIKLKKNHNYYYQVQGQLNVTKRKYCFFVVWTPRGILYEKIDRDHQFWKLNINKLQNFYLDCVLPEIIDPRLPRKLPIRDRMII